MFWNGTNRGKGRKEEQDHTHGGQKCVNKAISQMTMNVVAKRLWLQIMLFACGFHWIHVKRKLTPWQKVLIMFDNHATFANPFSSSFAICL